MTTIYLPSEKEKIYREKVKIFIQRKGKATNKEIRDEFKIGWAMTARILDYLNS